MRWTPKLEFPKDPSDVIDFTLNYAAWLKGDTINTVTVTGENITIDSNTNTNTKVTIFVSGGSAGATGKVKTTIVTNNSTPRTLQRTFKVRIEEL